MFRAYYFVPVLMIALFAAGCGVKAQTYVMTKERVGIANAGGNAGYLAGTPHYVEPQKKTRKVYIFELSKPVPEGEVRKIEEEISKTSKAVKTEAAAQEKAPEVSAPAAVAAAPLVPFIGDQAPVAVASKPAAGPKEAVTYTVLKDDTLQKIAKKFYDSYGKWVKIYDANKAKIKNPNFVKPGTILTIPGVEETKP